MPLERRSFIKSIGASIPALYSFSSTLSDISYFDKIDWNQIRQLFPITQWDKIHFNSGSAGVMPTVVLDYLFELIRYMNSRAPYDAWNIWQEIKKENIERLAQLITVNSDEIQIVRNTTEALNMIIYGLSVQSGNQVIISNADYPFAINAWKNRAKRDGIVVKEINLTLPMTDREVVDAYEKEITSNTKYIHVTHMTHREGHIMPVDLIATMAATHGVEVIIDGAHMIGQTKVDLSNPNISYYASSLHKWLNAPHGTGLLYVQKDKISSLHNHPSSYDSVADKIDKFEHIGTRAFHQEIGISAALDFYELIGIENKIRRLQELKRYWTDKLSNEPNIKFHTDLSESHSCAVSTFSIEGLSGGQIVKIFDKEYDIHAKSVGGPWGSGVRISVNIFTNHQELDTLVSAIKQMAIK